MHGDSAVEGPMNIDKLPFHICTLLCPIMVFVQFNKKLSFLKEPVAMLAIVAPMMYLCYPNGAVGDISPLCYKIMQAFLYHGLVFAWGLNMLSTRTVVPSIKRSWQSLVALICVAIWAALGNAIYSNSDHEYDWFFLSGSAFPFVPAPLMPVAVIGAIFGLVVVIYGLYYAFIAIKKKHNK